MKLSEMSRKQMEAYASKKKIVFEVSFSDAKLRKCIKDALRMGKEVSAVPAPPDAAWPAEWSIESRKRYYTRIVGGDMPADDATSYAKFVEALDTKIAGAKVNLLPDMKPDCYGIYYDSAFEMCTKHCSDMPACKAIHTKRPELVDEVKAITQAMAEATKVTDDDLSSMGSSTSKPAKKTRVKRKKRFDADSRFVWTEAGETLAAFMAYANDEDNDPDLIKVFKWMYERMEYGFTFVEAVKMFDISFEDAEALTRETLTFLIKNGDIKELG